MTREEEVARLHEEDEVTAEGGVIVRVVRTKKKVLGLEKGRLIFSNKKGWCKIYIWECRI